MGGQVHIDGFQGFKLFEELQYMFDSSVIAPTVLKQQFFWSVEPDFSRACLVYIK